MFVNDLFGSTNEDQQRLDPKCWKGYKKQGTKMKGGVRVNNCVPAEEGRDWDEGNTEPANNFAITINGRQWKVFQGHGYYADDEREMKQYYKLKDWCRKKSEQTGKQWEVYRTGAPATESVSEVSDKTLTSYLNKVHDDSLKHDKDPTKRSAKKRNKSVAGFSRAFNKLDSRKEGVKEGSEFGSNYAEQLAQQVFDHNPNISKEDDVLNLGYNIAKSELGSRASGIFRDEDFPGDFVSAYSYLQKQGVAEGSDKLQGTPVVSLSDFDGKDTKKDKYGRTVPKKLKKDDPRVKFHKDEKQGVAEGSDYDLDVRLMEMRLAGYQT